MQETPTADSAWPIAVASILDTAGTWVLAVTIGWIAVTLTMATVVVIIARLALTRAQVKDIPAVVAELRGYLPGIASWLLPARPSALPHELGTETPSRAVQSDTQGELAAASEEGSA